MFNKDRIIELIKEKDWTAYKLCKEANMAQSTLSDILNGKKKNPSANTLQKIATALGVSVDEFFKAESATEEQLKNNSEEMKIPQEYSDKYKVTSRDKKQYEEEMKKANESFFLNDELSEESKKEMLDLMSELFWQAKAMNKRKPKDK